MSGRGRELIEYLWSPGLLQVAALLHVAGPMRSGIRGDKGFTLTASLIHFSQQVLSVPYCVPGTDR